MATSKSLGKLPSRGGVVLSALKNYVEPEQAIKDVKKYSYTPQISAPSSTLSSRSYTQTAPAGYRYVMGAGNQYVLAPSQQSNLANKYLRQIKQETSKIEEEQRARFAEAKDIYKGIEDLFAPGGSFGQGYVAALNRAKEQSVASGMQSLVSSGLANTTQAAGLATRFEEEVGAPARLKLEDLRIQNLAQARQATAGLLERVQQPYPDYGTLLQLFSQMGG